MGGAAVKNNRQLLDGRWDKHDDKDAANIADLIAQGKCMFYEYPLMTLRNVRALIRAQAATDKAGTWHKRVYSQSTSLHSISLNWTSTIGSSETLAVVRECLDPSAIAGMEYDDILPYRGTGQNDVGKGTPGGNDLEDSGQFHWLHHGRGGLPMKLRSWWTV